MIRAFQPALCGLLVWASAGWAQRPSEADATAAIERTREKALAYTRSLPDFMCTEVIHRYQENRPAVGAIGRTWVNPTTKWLPTDKLTVKLSFFQQKEEHKLIAIDDKTTDRNYTELTGGIGAGEFGGTLQGMFDPASQTAFRWESWKNVRKHRIAIYAYRVEAAHSRYAVINGAPGHTHQAIVGFHGTLETDSETGELLHFTYVADEIPADVKLDKVSTAVEYDFADVGGRTFLLPARSQTMIQSPEVSVRCDTEFRQYAKFSSDSIIKFGDGK
jgi:hypothetical protein